MGQIVSFTKGRLVRHLQNFNVENRAHKIISKDKPVPAPKHESTLREVELLRQERPDLMEEIKRKDMDLDERLKKVYVMSHDHNPTPISNKKVKLPQKGNLAVDNEDIFGSISPENVPRGRISLLQAVQILTEHKESPVTFNANYFASTYKIDKDDTEKLLKYFEVPNVVITKKEDDKTSKKAIPAS